MRLSANLVAGILNSGVSALLSLIVSPFYLKLLGAEAFGLIGFANTLMVLLAFLDLGLAPTTSREVARSVGAGNVTASAPLVFSLERIYFSVGGLLIALFAGLSLYLSRHWLHPVRLSELEVVAAIRWMGLAAGLRWSLSLYNAALQGAQKIPYAAAVNVGSALLSAMGGLALVAFVSPSVELLFTWQAMVGALNLLLLRALTKRVLGGSRAHAFSWSELQRVWRFSMALSVLALAGSLIFQLDKLILSKSVPLDSYGRYCVASLFAGGIYLVITPIYNVLYPRFSSLLAAGQDRAVWLLYDLSIRLVTMLLFPIAMTAVLYGQAILLAWTHDALLAQSEGVVLALLVCGSALHGVMYVPYALQLAHGDARLLLYISAGALVFYVPALVYMISLQGVVGAAKAWLGLHVFYMGFATWMAYGRYYQGRMLNVLLDMVWPACVTATVGFAWFLWIHDHHIVPTQLLPLLVQLLLCVASGCAAILAVSPLLRRTVWKSLCSTFGQKQRA